MYNVLVKDCVVSFLRKLPKNQSLYFRKKFLKLRNNPSIGKFIDKHKGTYLTLLLILCILPLASALTFTEDTTFTQGNINYVFKEGVSVDDFELVSGGAMIDDHKISLLIEGGTLDVVFYEWSNINDHLIGLKSSVPQDVTFRVFVDGSSYYFYDGKTYSLDKYSIGVEEVEGSFILLNDEDTSLPRNTIQKLDWYEAKLIEFEVETTTLADGRIVGKTFAITYLGAFITLIVLIIIIVVVTSSPP